MRTKVALTIISLILAILGSASAGYVYLSNRSISHLTNQKTSNKKNSSNKENNDNEQSKSNDTTVAENKDVSEYKNARFGFQVSYPKTWRLTESQNGDGAEIIPPSEASPVIRVYGFNNVMGDSLTKTVGDQEDWMKEDRPNLKVVNRDNITVSNFDAIKATWEYDAAQEDSPLQGKVNKQVIVFLNNEVGYCMEMVVSKDNFKQYEQVLADIAESFRLN